VLDKKLRRFKETIITAVNPLVEEKTKPLPEYSQQNSGFVISGFRREIEENCALLG